MFRADIRPAYKTCYNIQSNDFFLPWRTFVVLTLVIPVSEVIVIFLQLILFANTTVFFCPLLALHSHSFWEGKEISTAWHCVEEINHSRDSWFVETMTYKPAFHAWRDILHSFFYAYSVIVDNFVIVSLFLEKHYIPQLYRWPTN